MHINLLRRVSRNRSKQSSGHRSSTRTAIEALSVLVIIIGGFTFLAYNMGMANLMRTLMNTAHDLILNTVLWLMGVTVLMGALSGLLAEFGVVQMLEKILRPLMKPLFNLPGAAALGAVATFLSDNPAIIALSKNNKFARYFKTYQFVSLTNFGTAFGMGLVVLVTMMSFNYIFAPLIGFAAACVGCLISTRLMQRFTLKAHPEYDCDVVVANATEEKEEEKTDAEASIFMRALNAILSGGKNGVDLGLAIIPGVVIITTLVIIFTNEPPVDASGAVAYTGAANQGVGLLPVVVGKINFIFDWIFGFQSPDLIAFPLTALGAVGAALGIVPSLIEKGIIDGNAIAVFTAIGMCWSGYFSTHAAMLDTMGFRHLISKAIIAHTIAGLCAGILAHWLWVGFHLLCPSLC